MQARQHSNTDVWKEIAERFGEQPPTPGAHFRESEVKRNEEKWPKLIREEIINPLTRGNLRPTLALSVSLFLLSVSRSLSFGPFKFRAERERGCKRIKLKSCLYALCFGGIVTLKRLRLILTRSRPETRVLFRVVP